MVGVNYISYLTPTMSDDIILVSLCFDSWSENSTHENSTQRKFHPAKITPSENSTKRKFNPAKIRLG